MDPTIGVDLLLESESVKKDDARFLSFVQQQKIIVKKGRKSLEQHFFLATFADDSPLKVGGSFFRL